MDDYSGSSFGTPGRHTFQEMVQVTRDLLNLYEGHQIGYVRWWLATFVRNPSIRRRYLELASYYNVVRFIVDRVATNGYVPCRVIMLDNDTSKPNPEAQAIWDDVSSQWMSGSFSGFVQTTARMAELLRVVTVGVEWDAWNDKLAFGLYSAAELKVEYEKDNCNKLEPDYYVFTDRYTGAEKAVYDFSDHSAGESGVVWQTDGKAPSVAVLDPLTGRSLNPFVAFRTFEGEDYYPWDGQWELATAQSRINRLVTRLAVLAEMGTNKILVLSGAGWTDNEGNLQAIPIDITQAVKEPADKAGESHTGPKMRWDGPQVIEEIKAVNILIHTDVVQMATQFRISPASITSTNDPSSGFSAQISEFALAEKHSGGRDIFKGNLSRLVRNTMLTWNHYGAVGKRAKMRFPDTVRPYIFVPDYMGAASISQHADADTKLIQTGVKRKLTLILKWEPGIPVTTAYELADQDGTGGTQAGKSLDDRQITALQGIAASVASGALSREAGEALIKLMVPRANDIEIEALLTPVADATPIATIDTGAALPDGELMPTGQDVKITEAAVLNGAQIAAAFNAISAVAAGQIPRDAGIGLLTVMFNLTPQQAETVMGSADRPKATAGASGPDASSTVAAGGGDNPVSVMPMEPL